MGDKIFMVSIPIDASVTVFVEAKDEAEADDIASFNATLGEGEMIDFSSMEAYIEEITLSEVPKNRPIFKRKKAK